jgi:hypothetical protein
MDYRDVMRCVSSACCAALLMCSVGDLRGMEYVREREVKPVRISESASFLQIGKKQAKDIRSISFEGPDLDSKFLRHWDRLFIGRNFSDLIFDGCCFRGDALSILNGVTVVNFTAKNCGITADDSDEILRYVYPHSIRIIDLSNNKLGEQEDLFEAVLQRRIYNLMSLTLLNLKGNGFSGSFVDRIVTSLNPSIDRIVF